jgi:LmbE family N-acetylglucosaminyl deacetylase
MPGPAQTFPPLHDLTRIPPGPVLVVAPHPDDEIIGCGGAIALHTRRGDPVHVALVSGGEAGGDADTRMSESRKAVARLGSTEVTCLGAVDGAVADDPGVAARIRRVAERVQPVVVYAPSPFEMHADHVATCDAVGAAFAGREDLTVLLFEVNAEHMATFLLDITPVSQAKREALTVFASQIGSIDIVAKCDARNRARTVNVDLPDVTHAEGFLQIRPDDIASVRQHLRDIAAILGILPDA